MRAALKLILAVALGLAIHTSFAATNAVPPEMQLEPLPNHVPHPKDNPSTPGKVALGRLLFFDPILSASGDVACATCHLPSHGWSDGRPAPIGVAGTGLGPERVFHKGPELPVLERNTPTLLNVGFNGLVAKTNLNPSLAPMFWDSRVSSLEAQALAPIRMREEMRGDACAESEALDKAVQRVAAIPEYRERFRKVFGESPDKAINAANLARAMAAFERTLITANSPFDRYLRGEKRALTELQQRGLKAFQQAGCVQCHGGPMFSDYKLHFIGVTDPTPGGRREFRTPTLRNLRHTAPYMHNGSQRTLEEVMRFYDDLSETVTETLDGGDKTAQPPLDPLLRKLNLNPEDFPALIAFLDALNDDGYDQTAPASVPSGLPVSGSARREGK